MFDEWKRIFNFILALLIVIFFLTLYVKSPVVKRNNKKFLHFFHNYWLDLLILILTPFLLYIQLTDIYNPSGNAETLVHAPLLGFILSLIFISYLQLTMRFKKVRVFYFLSLFVSVRF
ncbi:hypothetical protein LEP1GSC123_2071 [Leptospira borgpetersenii str. 200701203]|uniref:Uncharacterized protein n=1 Tax=Leptospira borgpetersenii str. 200701203 TaxID=1193007 RepID=M3GZ45_LEPBO|nr:hypothetical protein LEP1GSC123_2071 [Leptospira borgpetersenii str. 200701203]